jgi:hypothetical protein
MLMIIKDLNTNSSEGCFGKMGRIVGGKDYRRGVDCGGCKVGEDVR